jgi:hypothetical protein
VPGFLRCARFPRFTGQLELDEGCEGPVDDGVLGTELLLAELDWPGSPELELELVSLGWSDRVPVPLGVADELDDPDVEVRP